LIFQDYRFAAGCEKRLSFFRVIFLACGFAYFDDFKTTFIRDKDGIKMMTNYKQRKRLISFAIVFLACLACVAIGGYSANASESREDTSAADLGGAQNNYQDSANRGASDDDRGSLPVVLPFLASTPALEADSLPIMVGDLSVAWSPFDNDAAQTNLPPVVAGDLSAALSPPFEDEAVLADLPPVVISDLSLVWSPPVDETISLLAMSDDLSAVWSPFADDVARLVNNERARQGVAPVEVRPALIRGAQRRAQESSHIGLDHFISHVRPEGSQWHTVFAEVNLPRPSPGWASENVARGFPTPEYVVSAWMASSAHRVNLLSPEWVITGVGVSRNSWGSIDVVQWFGADVLYSELNYAAPGL